jgi:hypothetical protein
MAIIDHIAADRYFFAAGHSPFLSPAVSPGDGEYNTRLLLRWCGCIAPDHWCLWKRNRYLDRGDLHHGFARLSSFFFILT